MFKHPRILFFIKGPVPSTEDRAEALLLGTNVAFRNNLFISADDAIEACDGVAGDVPAEYLAKCPKAADVLTAFNSEAGKVLNAKEAKKKAAAQVTAAPKTAPAVVPGTVPFGARTV